jgi:hypothetical protein
MLGGSYVHRRIVSFHTATHLPQNVAHRQVRGRLAITVVCKFHENCMQILHNLHVIAPDRQYISYPVLGRDDKDSHSAGRSLF